MQQESKTVEEKNTKLTVSKTSAFSFTSPAFSFTSVASSTVVLTNHNKKSSIKTNKKSKNTNTVRFLDNNRPIRRRSNIHTNRFTPYRVDQIGRRANVNLLCDDLPSTPVNTPDLSSIQTVPPMPDILTYVNTLYPGILTMPFSMPIDSPILASLLIPNLDMFTIIKPPELHQTATAATNTTESATAATNTTESATAATNTTESGASVPDKQ